jgi:serine/threonine protein kinase
MTSESDYPRLGRYQVVNRIASGGMAEVFLARAVGAMGFQRLVALKLIHANFTRDQEFVKMFIDEARIAMHLHHRNIVQVFDLDQVNDTYFIAMEYVHGVNVYDLYERFAAQDRWVDVPLALYIVAEISKGLHFAHTRTGPDGRPLNIVHRDVSPQNVLLSFEGEVKLTDFGIATAAERLHQTAAGIVKGKYAYMAPERLEERPVDGRVDVFAAGVLLYELLVGENPFAGPSAVETIEAVLSKDVPAPSSRGAAVNPKLDEIVLTALAKEPAERFPSAQALADALTEFAMDMTFARKDMASGDSALAATLAELFPERARTAPTFADPRSLELPGVVPPPPPPPSMPQVASGEQDIDAPTVLRMSPVTAEELDTTASNESMARTYDDAEADEGLTTDSGHDSDGSSRTLAIDAVELQTDLSEPDDDGFAPTMLSVPSPDDDLQGDTIGPGANFRFPGDRTGPTGPTPHSGPGRASPSSGGGLRAPAPQAPGVVVSPGGPGRPTPYPIPQAPHEAGGSAGPQRLNVVAWVLGGVAAVLLVIAMVAVLGRGSSRAEISIRTRPSGAEVRINGKLQPESTPLLAKVSGSGPILIELTKEGYEPLRKEVRLVAGETLELNPALIARTGALIVSPEPSSAEVVVNGQSRGTGKVMVQGLAFGQSVKVRVQAKGFEPQEHNVMLSSEDPKVSLRIALARKSR